MGHRHLPNTLLTFEIDQDQNQYHGTAEESYSTTGRVVAAENGSYAYPTEHRVTNGGYSASQQDYEGSLVENSSSGFRLGGHYMQPAFSGSSYNPSPHFLTARSNDITPENNAGHAHPNFHNWPAPNEIEGGSLAPTMGIVRGPLKRKSPDNSVVCEGGDTSRYYAAGSSSSSESWPEKPTVNHQTYRSSSNGLPPYWSDGISIGSEVFQRNVRSRSRLDLESNTWRSYPSTYSSNHHCPMTQPISRPGTVDNTNLNTSVHAPNHNTMFPAAHWRLQTSEYNGMNHERTQFFAGTNTTETGGHYHGPILSRNPVLPPQYPHVPHPQAVRENGINYSQGDIPLYAADSSFTYLGNEASSSQNHLQLPSESYSSQHSMPLSTRGWHSNHRDRDSRSRRFHRHSIVVDGHDRMRSEAFTMVDRSSMSGSRNMFDQYRDMRLDVDNMSYEELLALGERIGSVSTGLSEEVVPKCLMVKTYCLSDCNVEEASCAICLEKYEKGEEIGRMRKCGHEYHVGCVKRWLTMKNVCPICKGPAKTDDDDGS